MKVVTVVGARPQFIKAAVVCKELSKCCEEVLVHTGQHYDYNMSEKFFEELDIPTPKYNLGVAGGTHAEMTARMLIEIEKVLVDEKPDMVLIYGDTNSTLAAALTAAKLHIPICHVEAGTRTHSMTNPEEINRVCVDHISSLLLASTEENRQNLCKENLKKRSYMVGDPMYDAFVNYRDKAEKIEHELITLDGKLISMPSEFYYLTCHREENTVSDENLLQILTVAGYLDKLLIYPVHPRNKHRAKILAEENQISNLLLVEPVGYLTSNYMVNHAQAIITDSGGLQREAFFAGKKCVTVLDFEVWPETMVDNRNQLAKPIAREIVDKLMTKQQIDSSYRPFGDGRASEKIAGHICAYLGMND